MAKSKPVRPKKFMIIAGEVSGDLLGAALVESIRDHYPDAIFIGVGGVEMQLKDVVSIFPMEELSLMGIAEVLPHLIHLFGRRDELIQLAEWQNVDMLITIDAPDFNLRVAKKMKEKLGIPCVHYVSPSVWAWRQGRAKKMSKYLDHVLALFPFEPRFYRQYNLPCTFVGHPMVERLSHLVPTSLDYPKNDGAPLIALVPGSRTGVIQRMLPEMLETFRRLKKDKPELRAVIPMVNKKHKELLQEMAGDLMDDIFLVDDGRRFDAIKDCVAAIVTSGTSNLEVAMMGTPMVVGYKLSGLTYAIAKRLVKIPYASPVNWVAGKKIIPEFIQDEYTADNLYEEVRPLIDDTDERGVQVLDLEDMRQKFRNTGVEGQAPSDIAASIISQILSGK